MQPLRVSCLETVLSTTSSFTCTYVASFLVLAFIGVPVTHGQNLLINLVLLAIQIARHLFWRRLFTVHEAANDRCLTIRRERGARL
jgi:hypothetical protein